MTNLVVAESALQYLNPHDRQEWYEAAMMLKSEFGDDAFHIWDEWSQRGATYNARDARAVWRSCKLTGGFTIASLYYRARRGGWQGSTEFIRPCPDEYAARALERQVAQQQAETERKAEITKAAVKAQYLFPKLPLANPQHNHLLRKGIPAFNLRQLRDALVVPLFSGGLIINLQFIQPDGTKRFLKGGQSAGAYFSIGQPGEVIYLCEGFSTGATIRQVTGSFVLCAMSADNLMNVALLARKEHPATYIVICGDNDRDHKGQKAAREAAMTIGAEVMIPEFPAGHYGTDWNDYYLMEQEVAQ